MLIYPPGSDNPLRGDLLVRAVLRSDLTPIPQTVEFEVRDTPDSAGIKVGAVCRVGRERFEFLIIKKLAGGDDGRTQGDRPVKSNQFVGILASCAPVASCLQRSVVRYGSSLGDIYRACGAQVRIDSDFSVGVFACYKGMVPTFEIAKALQEEAGALIVTNGRVSFRRLADMTAGPAVISMKEDSTLAVNSDFIERHSVPFAFSTNAAGGFEVGRAESSRGVMYRPRATPRILNNLSTALIMRRKAQSSFAPHIMAGMRVNVADVPFVIITAAHVFEAGGDGQEGEQATRLWLGQVVKS